MSNTIKILNHTIAWYINQTDELSEVNEEYIEQQIGEGFTSGELNHYDADTDREYYGDWEIQNPMIGKILCMIIVEEDGVIVAMSELYTSRHEAMGTKQLYEGYHPDCDVNIRNFLIEA